MPVELVTQAEYARRRGVDPTTVRDAIRAGRISLIDGRIDPAVADVQWQRNTRARARNVGSVQAPQVPPPAGGQHAGAAPEPAGRESYDEARRRRELAEANLAELKLAELRGELLRADAVRAQVAKLAAGLREGLLQIPPRLAPVLAAGADAAKVQDALADALRQVLEQVSQEAGG